MFTQSFSHSFSRKLQVFYGPLGPTFGESSSRRNSYRSKTQENASQRETFPQGPAPKTLNEYRNMYAREIKSQKNLFNSSLETLQRMKQHLAALTPQTQEEYNFHRFFLTEELPVAITKAERVPSSRQVQESYSSARKDVVRHKNHFLESANTPTERQQATRLATTQMQAVDTSEKNYTKSRGKVQKQVIDDTGKVSAVVDYSDQRIEKSEGSLELTKNILADLDGMSGVERQNRGWFRRAITGNNAGQKEIIGEAQLKEALRGMNQQQIDALYNRITGETTGISIDPKKNKRIPRKESWATSNSRIQSRSQLDSETERKVENFQTKLLEDVGIMASLSSILLGNSNARTGLMMVVQGKGVRELQAAINDPVKRARFEDMLRSGEILNRDPRFLEKLTSALTNFGLAAAVPILTSGVVAGYVQTEKMTPGKNGVNWRGGKVGKNIGENGGYVGVNVDLAGIRVNASINDPQARVEARTNGFIQSSDKMAAAQEVVRVTKEENKGKRHAKYINTLSDGYLKAQTQINAIKTKNNVQAVETELTKNTMNYLARVEKLKGGQLTGPFALAGLQGWAVGLAGKYIDTQGEFGGLNTGAGKIEASILPSDNLSDSEVTNLLAEAGIQKGADGAWRDVNGRLIKNKQGILQDGGGKKVVWNITRVLTDNSQHIEAEGRIVSGNSSRGSTFKLINKSHSNEFLEKNPNASKYIYNLRAAGKTQRFQRAFAAGNLSQAGTELEKLLQRENSSMARGLLAEYRRQPQGDAKEAFLAMFSDRTSGSRVSHRIAENINNPQARRELASYYSKVAGSFARLSGISKADVMNQFEQNIQSQRVSTLGDNFPNGFFGYTAFSQTSAGAPFRQNVANVDNNFQIIGNTTRVASRSAQEKIRAQMKQNMTPRYLEDIRRQNPQAQNLTDTQLRNELVQGEIYSYLSFVPGSQCFNMGFVVAQGGGHALNTGSVVGNTGQTSTDFGLGVGMRWNKKGKEKEKKNEETTPDKEEVPPSPKPEPLKPETTPGKEVVETVTNSTSTPQGSASQGINSNSVEVTSNISVGGNNTGGTIPSGTFGGSGSGR